MFVWREGKFPNFAIGKHDGRFFLYFALCHKIRWSTVDGWSPA